MVAPDRPSGCGPSCSFFICVVGSALQFRVPYCFPVWRLLSFRRGARDLSSLPIASPLDAFAGLLLQVHMVQHLLLMMLAPPLILAGAPYLPILSGLPRRVYS